MVESLTSLLANKHRIAEQIDSLEEKIDAIKALIEESKETLIVLQDEKVKLCHAHFEINKDLAKAICPTEKELKSLYTAVSALVNPRIGEQIDSVFAERQRLSR